MVKAYGTVVDKSVTEFTKPRGLVEASILHEKLLTVYHVMSLYVII